MNGDDFPGILLNKYEERKMTSEEVKYWDPLEHVNAEKYKELTEKHPGLMRIRDVVKLTGRGRTSIYMDCSTGRFPRSLRIGAQAVAWKKADVYAWIESLSYVGGVH
jgi:prophage regulatory protein